MKINQCQHGVVVTRYNSTIGGIWLPGWSCQYHMLISNCFVSNSNPPTQGDVDVPPDDESYCSHWSSSEEWETIVGGLMLMETSKLERVWQKVIFRGASQNYTILCVENIKTTSKRLFSNAHPKVIFGPSVVQLRERL